MVKTLNTPSNSLHKRQSKDKHFEVQLKRVFAAFKRKPSTMLMVSIETVRQLALSFPETDVILISTGRLSG